MVITKSDRQIVSFSICTFFVTTSKIIMINRYFFISEVGRGGDQTGYDIDLGHVCEQ